MTVYKLEICENSLLNDPFLSFEQTDSPNINIGEKILHARNKAELLCIYKYFENNYNLNRKNFVVTVFDKGHYLQECDEINIHTIRLAVKAINDSTFANAKD